MNRHVNVDRDGLSEEDCSEDNEQYSLIDDLFILKESILENTSNEKRPSRNAKSYLTQISNILRQFPNHAHNLYKWGFLTNELLYALRTNLFKISLDIMVQILREVRQIPDFYLTKKFLFFICEKLYHSMGNNTYDLYDDINNNKSSDQSASSDIIIFVTEIISIDRMATCILYDLGFFILINSIVTHESCILYNTVFKDIFYYQALNSIKNRKSEPEAMYEIKRNIFDPEVIFREKDIIELKKPILKYKRGIFEKIYNECTNLRHFMELSIKDSLDLVLYKRIPFINDDLDMLIRDKNEKAIKIYRRGLEEGGVPDGSYNTILLQSLDDKKLRLDAALILYYFMDILKDYKGFTEGRIRDIFECLEYHCEHECVRNNLVIEYVNNSDKIDNPRVSSVYDLDTLDNDISFGSMKDMSFDTPCDIKRPKLSHQTPTEEIHPVDINRCNRIRILKLLKELYGKVNREYYYKPSYLILMRSQLGHCPEEQPFIDQFFRDFIYHITRHKNSLARVMFPSNHRVRSQNDGKKLIELKPDMNSSDMMDTNVIDYDRIDSNDIIDYDIIDSNDVSLADQIKKMKNKTNEQENHVNKKGDDQVKIVRSRIVSESEEMPSPLDK